MDEPLPSFLAAAGFTLVGALLAAADTALTSLSPTRLSALIDQDHEGRRAAFLRIQRDDAKIRSRYLLGRVLCTAFVALFLIRFFDAVAPSVSPWAAVLATALLTGTAYEVSTTLGRKFADRLAPVATRYLRPIEMCLTPVAAPLGWLGSGLARRRAGEETDPRVTEAEVEILVEEVERSGLFGREPAEMIKNVLEFADLTAHHVMVPRAKMQAVSDDTPLSAVHQLVVDSGHSRYPVYRDEPDNIVGLLYAKDVFKALGDGTPEDATVDSVVRTPVRFVHESQSLSSLLRDMRSRRQHMFIVVDEFGSTSGLVTLEDVLEEIVGDIRDEHDEGERAPIRVIDDGSLVASADMSMSDLADYLGTDIPADEAYASLGGMLTHEMGHVPQEGTVIEKFGLRFSVRRSDDKQVVEVKVDRIKQEPASPEGRLSA